MNTNGDAFRYELPVWIPSLQGHSVGGTLPVKGSDGRWVVLMFSTSDKAKAYLDAAKVPTDYVPRPIEDPLALFGFILLMEKKGAAHVSIDPQSDGSITVHSLAKFRERIEAKLT